jgi:DNA invertase Pin-like site-specific DNA recombinase
MENYTKRAFYAYSVFEKEAGGLTLNILGGLAECERELIKARITERRERAKGVVSVWDRSTS